MSVTVTGVEVWAFGMIHGSMGEQDFRNMGSLSQQDFTVPVLFPSELSVIVHSSPKARDFLGPEADTCITIFRPRSANMQQ